MVSLAGHRNIQRFIRVVCRYRNVIGSVIFNVRANELPPLLVEAVRS